MQLLKLRYLQLKRDLSYWTLLIAAAMFFIAKGISELSPLYCMSLAALFFLFLYSYHINRKDLPFIYRYLVPPTQNICINYNLFTLPVSAGIFVSHYFPAALALHVSVTLIPFLSFKTKTPALAFIGRRLPPSQFEWIAGLRKNFYVLIVLLLVSLFLSPVKFFGTVSLFLLNSIFVGFYNYFEPLAMLNPAQLSAEHFLKQKTGFITKLILYLDVPLLLINSVFHPDIAWFNGCFVIGFLIVAHCAIYIKYAYYKPNSELSFHMDYLFLFASVIIPFLLPVSLFLTASHKKKALQNLSLYTDDPR